MPTSDTVISRLLLVHPDLNHDGGSGLHTKIRNLYTKLGDMVNSRFFTADGLANAASVDVEHNFKTAFAEMRVLLFLRDTGTGELTRINTTSSPSISQFTIAATPSFTTTRIRITNNSGASRDIAAVVVHGKGAEALSDLNDVDLSTPAQSGQALVYNSGTGKFEPGASGDASFKMQQIAANVLTIKGGYLKLIDGRELATYDAPTYGVDISVSLLTLLATPVNGTTYYLYIDLDSLGSEQTQGLTGRKLYQITQSNMVLSTTSPVSMNRARYVPIGTVVGSAGNTYETGNFTTYAAKAHDNGPLSVNPKVYSLSQAVGSVGSSGQIQAGHNYLAASFPSVGSSLSWWNLQADANDDSANGRNLALTGTGPFTGTGLFGGANDAVLLSASGSYRLTNNAFLNIGNTISRSFGGWFRPSSIPGSYAGIFGLNSSGNEVFSLDHATVGLRLRFASATPGTVDQNHVISTSLVANTYYHFAVVFEAGLMLVCMNGKIIFSVSSATIAAISATNIFYIGASDAATGSFSGSVNNVFFNNATAYKPSEIQKIMAAKITHNAAIVAANQDWKFILGTGFQKLPSWQPVVDQSDSNVLYADLSDLSSTETVDIALLDLGLTAAVVPAVPPFDQTYSSNPTFPISHGLAEVPWVHVGYKDSSNDWHWTTGEGAVKADSTQLKGSIQTYFDAGATQVRIRAVVGASPTGVKDHVPAVSAGLVAKEGVIGRTNGVAVPAGYVGEFIQSKFSTASASGVTAGQYGNLSSISLTSGTWLIFATVSNTRVSGQTYYRGAVSAYTGNITTDHTDGFNQLHSDNQWDHTDKGSITIAGVPVSLSATSTYYIKGLQDGGTWAQANWQGHITAIRIA
jgi:hypothetical protein